MLRFRPRKQNSRKAEYARRFPAHLKWLRGRNCILAGKAGHVCEGRMEAAHYDGAGDKGMGLKVADYHAFPACSAAHGELHRIGQDTWQAKWSVNLARAVAEYANASPHKKLWEQDNG
jgi:hypothetical protein